MMDRNSKVRNSSSIEDQDIINMLKSFQPTPSPVFEKRMAKAPWNLKPRLYKYAFQICVTVGIILLFLIFTPSTPPAFTSTNTPTQTNTSNPLDFSTPELFSTPAPSNISASTTPIG